MKQETTFGSTKVTQQLTITPPWRPLFPWKEYFFSIASNFDISIRQN